MANEKVYTGKIGAQELYKRIKRLIPTVDNALDINSYNPISNHAVTEALANFGGFEKANGTGADNHPDVATPSTKIIYLVEVQDSPDPDHFKEWIWSHPEGESGTWECIGDTSIALDDLVITNVEGVVSGTTMSVEVANNTYTRFDVPAEVETLIVDIGIVASEGNSSKSMFEFTLPEESGLTAISVVDANANECMHVSPMNWPDEVTYKGTVVNGITTVIGYPTEGDGLPDYTIRVRLATGSTPSNKWDKAVKVEDNGLAANEGEVWDLTHYSRNWHGMFYMDENILEVLDSNTSVVTDMSFLFYECPNLTAIKKIDTSSVENFTSMFCGSNAITEICDLDTSCATTMNGMFHGCSKLERIPAIDTSNVGILSFLFSGCRKITAIEVNIEKAIDVSDMFSHCNKLSEITLIRTHSGPPFIDDTHNMFAGCWALETAPAVDTSHVKNMSGMFSSCRSLTSLSLDTSVAEDLGSLVAGCSSLVSLTLNSTANCKSFYHTFEGCTSLSEIPTLDTRNAVYMSGMFMSCNQFTEFPVLDTSNVTHMDEMFYGCSAMQYAPSLDTSNCESFSSMFDGCRLLLELPDYDLGKAKNTSSMFESCTAIKTIPLYDMPVVENTSYMFYDCYYVDSGALDLYKTLYNKDIAEHTSMFGSCGYYSETGKNDLYLIHESWGGEMEVAPYTIRLVFTDGYTPTFARGTATQVATNCWDLTYESGSWANILKNQTELIQVLEANIPDVYSLNYAFAGCTKLEYVYNIFTTGALRQLNTAFNGCPLKHLSKFDTSKVWDFRNAFYYCGIETLPDLDFSSATNMGWAFAGSHLKSVSNLRIPAADTPTYLFYDCSYLTDVEIADMGKTVNIEHMFEYCPELTTVSLHNTDKIVYYSRAFSSCPKLTSVSIENISTLQTGDDMFNGCALLPSVSFTSLPNATSTQRMFSGCSSLQSIQLSMPKVENLSEMFANCTSLQTAILSNLNKATSLYKTFRYCTSLTTVSVDTHNVQNMGETFAYCSGMTAMPSLNSGKFSSMTQTFYNCTGIQRGAYDMYVQLSTQETPPSSHSETFTNCGDMSVSTAKEDLDKIPTSWGGNKAPWLLLQFTDGVTPSFSTGTATQVTASPNVWKLTTPNTTSWSYLLQNQTDLLQVLDSDSSDVTMMNYAFSGCSNLTTVVKLDTRSNTTFYYTFGNCTSLVSVPNFDYTSCTTLDYMFYKCTSLTGPIDIDAPKAQTAAYIFYYSGITSLGNLNLPNATYTSGLCSRCQSLVNVGTIYLPKAEDVSSFFYNCSSLESVDAIYVSTTNSTVSCGHMFYQCTNLRTVGRIVIPRAQYMYYMFYQCTALTKVPYFVTGNDVSEVDYMFYNCNNVQSGAYDAYVALSASRNVYSTNDTFTGCGTNTTTGIEDLTKIPISWGGYKGAPSFTCEYAPGTAPYNTSSFAIKTQISTSPNIWKITQTNTWYNGLFASDSNIIRVIEADTSNLTTLSCLFEYCYKLESVCELDTSKCTDFGYAFHGCENLASMPPFDVSKANYARNMLCGCRKLENMASTMYSRLVARGSSLSTYVNALSGCGIDTDGGYDVLTNIPLDWGGTVPCQKATIGGREYNVIRVGNQLWMAENLDWKYTGITIGSTSSSYTTKYANYYENNESAYGVNGSKQGLLYNHAAATSISTDDGWHLPTKDEWETLFSNLASDMNTLREIIRLNGDNYSSINTDWYDHTGLRMMPSGMGDNSSPTVYRYMQRGNSSGTGYYWTATALPSNPNYQAYCLMCSYNVEFYTGYGRDNRMSIRLVKNL